MREFQKDTMETKSAQVARALNNLAVFQTSLREAQRIEKPDSQKANISLALEPPVGQEVMRLKTLPDKYHPSGGTFNLRENVKALRKITVVTQTLTSRQSNLDTALGQVSEIDKQAVTAAIAKQELAKVKSWADEGWVEKEQLDAYNSRAETAEAQLTNAKEGLFADVNLPDHYFAAVERTKLRVGQSIEAEVDTKQTPLIQAPLVLNLPPRPVTTLERSSDSKSGTENEVDKKQEVAELLLVENIVERGDRQNRLSEDEVRLLKLLSQAEMPISRADIAQILHGDPDYAKVGVTTLLQNLDAKLQYLVGRQVIVSIRGRNGGQALQKCEIIWEDVSVAAQDSEEELLVKSKEQGEKELFSSEDAAIVATDFLAHGQLLERAGIKVDQSLLVRLIRAVPQDDLEVLKTMTEGEMNQYLNAIRMDGLSRALEVVTDPGYEENKAQIAEKNPDRVALLEITEALSQIQIGSKGANLLDKLIETPVEFIQVLGKDLRVAGISYKDHIPAVEVIDEEEEIEQPEKQNLLGIEKMRGAEKLREAITAILVKLDEAKLSELINMSQINAAFKFPKKDPDYVIDKGWVHPDNTLRKFPMFERLSAVALAYLAKPSNRRNIKNQHIPELNKIIREVAEKYDEEKKEVS